MKLTRIPFFLLLLIAVKGFSQTKPDSTMHDCALNIFLDCAYCDMDYMRSEIPIVNYVRDRKEANIDIVASSIACGSGGSCLTFVFIGQGKFKGQLDTLRANVTSFETDDGMRQKIAQTLKAGLIRTLLKRRI